MSEPDRGTEHTSSIIEIKNLISPVINKSIAFIWSLRKNLQQQKICPVNRSIAGLRCSALRVSEKYCYLVNCSNSNTKWCKDDEQINRWWLNTKQLQPELRAVRTEYDKTVCQDVLIHSDPKVHKHPNKIYSTMRVMHWQTF